MLVGLLVPLKKQIVVTKILLEKKSSLMALYETFFRQRCWSERKAYAGFKGDFKAQPQFVSVIFYIPGKKLLFYSDPAYSLIRDNIY